MSLIRTKGDLISLAFEGHFDVIVHGCNCYCAMGAGIAVAIANRIPAAYEADKNTRVGELSKLGTYTKATAMTRTNPVKLFTVINAYTQYSPSVKRDVFEYEGFQRILDSLAVEYKGSRFGFPYIGMGLAGGDKKRIIPMIEAFAGKVTLANGTVTLVEFG